MHRFLISLFSWVCGENPQHIWSPGGELLPCCERCTGLYVAALVATALHLALQPGIRKRFLQFHALCLLQLGLFILPALPQSAVLRTLSGSLFGFGVVAFLWPAIAVPRPATGKLRSALMAYIVGMLGCLAMIPVLAIWGGRPGAFILTCLALAGFLTLALLVAVNIARIFVALARVRTREA